VMTDFWYNHIQHLHQQGPRSIPDDGLRDERHPPTHPGQVQRPVDGHGEKPCMMFLSRQRTLDGAGPARRSGPGAARRK
jgi:hypothetical protein